MTCVYLKCKVKKVVVATARNRVLFCEYTSKFGLRGCDDNLDGGVYEGRMFSSEGVNKQIFCY